MKIRFKRILCPIDFDRISIPALELAVSMARQNKGRVYLLYIIPKVAAPRLSADIREDRDGQFAHSRAQVAKGQGSLQDHRTQGRPVSGLLKAEAELSADLDGDVDAWADRKEAHAARQRCRGGGAPINLPGAHHPAKVKRSRRGLTSQGGVVQGQTQFHPPVRGRVAVPVVSDMAGRGTQVPILPRNVIFQVDAARAFRVPDRIRAAKNQLSRIRRDASIARALLVARHYACLEQGHDFAAHTV